MARAAFPKGSLPFRVRGLLVGMFATELFAGSFGVRGRSGNVSDVLSLAIVLQFTENPTGRLRKRRDRMLWKYTRGMELTDTGFDSTVLTTASLP
ncbi:hypothetical protein [Streptomyces sp. NBC_00467]|uniref:hypothetical protein n=1 Tax=Streptomyces sp. NBC_00467 TaxID=2975752 RepID=UPI002E170D41